MSNKILLAKDVSSGNLKKHTQSYHVYYLQREAELIDKVRLEILAPSSDGEVAVKSYYMNDPAVVELLIYDLIKGLMFFKKQRGELNEFTMGFIQSKIAKKTLEIGKDVRQGLYDNGIKGV